LCTEKGSGILEDPSFVGVMMNILLINPPSKELHQVFFPLGLAHVAGALVKGGHEVTVWDINAERWSREEALKKFEQQTGAFSLVGITALSGDYPYVKWFTRSIKKIDPGQRVVMGGHLASALPEFLMDRLPIDFLVRGEGDETVVRLVETLERDSDPGQVKGICYRTQEGEVRSTAPRPLISDLTQLPPLPWDLFPMHIYLGEAHRGFNEYGNRQDSGLMSIMASRGCPFRCLYCDHTIKGFRPRYRPAGEVILEIKTLLERYGERIKTFYFWDDILVWDRAWAKEFCEGLSQEGLDIRWSCNAHVSAVEYSLMSLMRETGCWNVRFGIESGSQRILDSLNKGVRVEQALEALNTCLEAGLTLTLYVMVGMEGESHETVKETIDFFERLIRPINVYQFNKIHFFMLTPFPGTELFNRVCREGLVQDVDEFLTRGCDAHFDIPLNISGCPDQVLVGLKQELEREVSLIIEDRKNHLHNVLFDIKRKMER